MSADWLLSCIVSILLLLQMLNHAARTSGIRSNEGDSMQAPPVQAASSPTSLLELDQGVLVQQVLSHLSLVDLAALACCHSQLKATIAEALPNLWRRAANQVLPGRRHPRPVDLPSARSAVQHWRTTLHNIQTATHRQRILGCCLAADTIKTPQPCLSPDGQWLFLTELIFSTETEIAPHPRWPACLYNTRTEERIQLQAPFVFTAAFWDCSTKLSLCYRAKRRDGGAGPMHVATVFDIAKQEFMYTFPLGRASSAQRDAAVLARWMIFNVSAEMLHLHKLMD